VPMDKDGQLFSHPLLEQGERSNEHWPIGWQGAFIWAGLPPVPTPPITFSLKGVPSQAWNRYCYLRKTVTLETLPQIVPARMTADSRFILYVNGVEVVRGPARAVPERLACVEVDLVSYLRQGNNVLAVLVGYYGRPMPWWVPAFTTFQLGLGAFSFEAPSLGIVSDDTWKGHSAPYVSIVPEDDNLERQIAGPPEIIDGRDLPWGWNTLDFDDTSWENATILQGGFVSKFSSHLPVAPFTAPELVDIAPLTAIPVHLNQLRSFPIPIREGNDPTLLYDETTQTESTQKDGTTEGTHTLTVYDATQMTLATPWIEVRGTAGTVIDIYCGEDVHPDGRVEIRPRLYALRCILAGRSGNETEYFEGFHPVGFRYLAVAVRGEAQVFAIGAIERHYPRVSEATFTCDDERLNRIWHVGARTLDLCSLDAFVDCPGREQRAWVGDSYIHALLSYATAIDWRLVRRHLQVCAQSRRHDGLLAMVAAGDFSLGSPTIPDYSLHWIRALARYLEYSGDVTTIRDLLPTAKGIITAFERYRGSDGFLHNVPNWIFIDWAMTERAEIIGVLDALYALTLTDYAWLQEQVTGDTQEIAVARAGVKQTQAAFESLWDETRGIYVDAADAHGPHRRVSQHTNALAILSGCAPQERWTRILDYILDEQRVIITPLSSMGGFASSMQGGDPAKLMPYDPETQVVGTEPFFAHFVHQAVVKVGRFDLLTRLCLRWFAQIERGNTTIEEFWDAPIGKASRAHAWSATPTYDLTAHLLGVRPLTPGFAQTQIRPHFGELNKLAGRVSTPFGFIDLDLTREGGTITIPQGIVAMLDFEDCLLAGGELHAGRHTIPPTTLSTSQQEKEL